MFKLIKYSFLSIIKSRFVLLYMLFLLAMTTALYQVDSDMDKMVLSLLNVLLLISPLISAVYATIYYYNSYEFMELMLAQPINRQTVFMSQVVAVGSSLSLAVVAGVGLPMLLWGADERLLWLLGTAVVLSLIFTALAFLAAVLTRDKAKAIGLAMLFWIFFSLIYDGLILYIVYSFSDYPLEKPILGLVGLNPVDLARIVVLMQLDVAALMGYTGAFFQQLLGSTKGMLLAMLVLLLWLLLPMWYARQVFLRKDV